MSLTFEVEIKLPKGFLFYDCDSTKAWFIIRGVLELLIFVKLKWKNNSKSFKKYALYLFYSSLTCGILFEFAGTFIAQINS